ncbi:MAG: hypothetical protein K6C99_05660 [Lachnospiraceae bacterium]|nr:hypothetical protein [Lachnospiraceae bacterium]
MGALSIFKKKRMIVLAIYFGFMIIYYFGINQSLSLKLNSVSMPSYAERVLPPKKGYFACCAGSRVGMEEVYRIPKDKVNDISYGEINRVVVEPFNESLYLNDLQVSVGGFESDCSYVYDYGDVVSLPEYRDDDGYCYIHVWGREYLGSGDGFTLYLLAIFSIYLVLPIVVFVIALKLLVYKVKNRKQKKSVEKETLNG